MGDPEDIKAWQRIDALLTTSGALREGDIAKLAAIGTRHVINLAMPDSPEALGQERELLAQAGIAYTAITVPFGDLQEEHYRRFVSVLESAARPAHIHCIMNWRVSAFLYRYHCEHGMESGEARQLMARQWEPDRSEYPQGEKWGNFVAAVGRSAA